MFVIPASLSLCPRSLWIQIPRRPGSTGALSHVLTLPETFSGCLQRGGIRPLRPRPAALAASQRGDSHNCRNPNDVLASSRGRVSELQRNQ